MENNYLHGYSDYEQERLVLQADILSEYIYPNLNFDGIQTVLELGCGTGGQTIQLLKRYPNITITGIDVSEVQIEKAKANIAQYKEFDNRVSFTKGFVHELDSNVKFDAIFICWVLEHVSNTALLLEQAKVYLKPNGKIFITEVYNDSFDYAPRIASFDSYYKAFNSQQISLGGNPNMGVSLGALLVETGYANIKVKPAPFFLDKATATKRKLFFEYWFDLMLSAKDQLLANNYITAEQLKAFETDYAQIYTDENAYFFYSPIQAEATN